LASLYLRDIDMALKVLGANMTDTTKQLEATSRREFMRRSAASVAVLAGASAASRATASPSRRWSHETDVLVIGSGAAALAATIAVVQAGSSVTVVECAPVVGGTTAKSAGAFWIPNNHLMRAAGTADPKDDAIRYMVRDAFPARYRPDLPHLGVEENEYALIEAYYDNSAQIIEALHSAGAIKPVIAPVYDYFDHTDLNKAPRGRALVPLKPDGTWGRGIELIHQLKDWLAAKPATFLLKHRVTGIERNSKGEVLGVSASAPDGNMLLRARKAVVFGTGGYSQNQQLLRCFQPGPVHGACSVPTAQGDFVKIGIEVGAMLGNMAHAWRSEVILEQALQSASVAVTLEIPAGDSMMLVNKYGRRVVDEKRNYNVRGRTHFVFDETENEYPNDLLFMIYDQRTAELFAGDMLLPEPGTSADFVITAPTLASLAQAIQQRLQNLEQKIGARALAANFPEGLQAQIEQFNRDARAGKDSQFRRGLYPYDLDWHKNVDSIERTDTRWPHNPGPNFTMYPFSEQGPYHAIIVGAGMLDTNGGPVISPRAQVLDTHGRPIPGLYGAGNCVASPTGQGYWGAGSTLGPALTFGTLAGRNAVLEPVKQDI
jgi:succinate dehydrogenase/fumarate reductase flavoprotein subunit